MREIYKYLIFLFFLHFLSCEKEDIDKIQYSHKIYYETFSREFNFNSKHQLISMSSWSIDGSEGGVNAIIKHENDKPSEYSEFIIPGFTSDEAIVLKCNFVYSAGELSIINGLIPTSRVIYYGDSIGVVNDYDSTYIIFNNSNIDRINHKWGKSGWKDVQYQEFDSKKNIFDFVPDELKLIRTFNGCPGLKNAISPERNYCINMLNNPISYIERSPGGEDTIIIWTSFKYTYYTNNYPSQYIKTVNSIENNDTILMEIDTVNIEYGF